MDQYVSAVILYPCGCSLTHERYGEDPEARNRLQGSSTTHTNVERQGEEEARSLKVCTLLALSPLELADQMIFLSKE
jgi:hypothetical protein